MIRLAARLAVSGGRESVVRLLLTAVGVAIGTTLLLLSAAADPAIRAHQRHEAWKFTNQDQAEREDNGDDGDPLLWRLIDDVVAGEELTVLQVAATGPGAPVPLGLLRVPSSGEVHVSPALARLLAELPTDRLADRFPSAPSGTIGDDYLAGPDELVAVVGLPADAMRGHGVLEVHDIRTAPAPFGFTDALRAILAIVAVGLLMPVLVFVSTSTRIGAARREQRFAALRLAGATPRQTNLIAAVEAGAAASVGAVLGAVGYLLLRPLAASIEIDGHASFVSDVRAPLPLVVAILLGVPLLGVLAAMASMRRLQISPLGVARRAVRSRPTVRRLVPLAVGSAGFFASLGLAMGSRGIAPLLPLAGTFALMIYGIVVAGPWLTVLAARAIRRIGRRAGTLLASRRLEDDPSAGFRAVSGVVLGVFVASVFSGVTPSFLADNQAGGGSLVAGSTLAAALPEGTTAAAAATALDAATAAGGGRGVVLHEDPDPDRPLRDPAAGRGLTHLVLCSEVGLPEVEGGSCPPGGTGWLDDHSRTVEPSPYSVAEVSVMDAATIVVETDGAPATTDRVRTAIAHAVPGASSFLGSEYAASGSRRLTQMERLANLVLALSLIIAGCGLAVAVAGGIIERKRPFALLRLSGMHLAELRRVALLEAAAPLLLIALASALLGLGTAAVIVTTTGEGRIPWKPPTPGYWVGLATGLVVALTVAAATLPLLGRSTAPSAVRFE